MDGVKFINEQIKYEINCSKAQYKKKLGDHFASKNIKKHGQGLNLLKGIRENKKAVKVHDEECKESECFLCMF